MLKTCTWVSFLFFYSCIPSVSPEEQAEICADAWDPHGGERAACQEANQHDLKRGHEIQERWATRLSLSTRVQLADLAVQFLFERILWQKCAPCSMRLFQESILPKRGLIPCPYENPHSEITTTVDGMYPLLTHSLAFHLLSLYFRLLLCPNNISILLWTIVDCSAGILCFFFLSIFLPSHFFFSILNT